METSTNNVHLMDIGEKNSDFVEALLQSDLFPEGSFLIYNHWLPLRVTNENIALACDTTNVVATHDTRSKRCTGVSFCTHLQVKRGVSLVIYFHVTSVDDVLQHLQCHLEHYREILTKYPGAANLELTFPMSLSLDEVKKKVFPHIGKSSIYETVPREGAIIVERPLPKFTPKL